MPYNGKDILKRSVFAEELKPKLLLAIYDLGETKHYIEFARTDKQGNVTAFAPMSTKKGYAFAEALLRYKNTGRGNGRLKGWVNGERIIQVSMRHMEDINLAWRKEPGKIIMKYSKELPIEDGEIDAPGIVFIYSTAARELYVHAYREWKGKATQLYHLPFHNVYETGRVCMGRSKTSYIKNDTLDSFMTRVEWLFFNTAASEIHYAAAWKGNINSLHKSLREGKPFPMDKLIARAKINKVLNNSDDEFEDAQD